MISATLDETINNLVQWLTNVIQVSNRQFSLLAQISYFTWRVRIVQAKWCFHTECFLFFAENNSRSMNRYLLRLYRRKFTTMQNLVQTGMHFQTSITIVSHWNQLLIIYFRSMILLIIYFRSRITIVSNRNQLLVIHSRSMAYLHIVFDLTKARPKVCINFKVIFSVFYEKKLKTAQKKVSPSFENYVLFSKKDLYEMSSQSNFKNQTFIRQTETAKFQYFSDLHDSWFCCISKNDFLISLSFQVRKQIFTIKCFLHFFVLYFYSHGFIVNLNSVS